MIAAVLNTVVILQFVMYWNSSPTKPKGKAKLSGPGANKARSTKNKLE